MRYLRLAFLFSIALATTGCFQMSTTIKVADDGSGTIEQRQFITAAGLAQLGQVRMGGRTFDPLSEESARSAASRLGEGVTYVSSTPIVDGTGQGRAITYSFTDINRVHIGFDAPVAGLAPGQSGPGVTCAMTTLDNGHALLRITVPQPLLAEGGSAIPPTDQIAMARSFLTGARISIALEPAGTVVRASSPFVDGNRVTLLEIDFDQLLKDDVLTRIRAAKTADDVKAVVATVPGLKLNLEPEITVEFAPAK
ncbi:MAG TPA: hypothetical protein VGJ29_02070 [Vicinamibacterales bacterium]|jgi:hypothetical protein